MPGKSPTRKLGVVAIAATVAIMLSFLFAAKGTLDRRAALSEEVKLTQKSRIAGDRAACKRINALDRAIQAQVRISIAALPKVSYYKQHPQELSRVLAQSRAEIKAFAPEKCP